MGVLEGLIGGAAQMAGNAMNNAAQMELQTRAQTFEAQQAEQANAFTERMANSAQSFSERMSSTSHQREVADLKAAGLNPILSAGGGGSSSPSGVGGSGQMAHAIMPRIGNLMEGVISSAMQIGLANAQSQKLEKETQLIEKRAITEEWKGGTEQYKNEQEYQRYLRRDRNAEAETRTKEGQAEALSNNNWMMSQLKDMIQKADPALGGILKLLQMFR